MPKIQNWIFYQEIKLTDVNWKTFVNMQLNAHITRHNQNNCTKCDHSVSHKMSAISMVCNNASCKGRCLVEYKAFKCPKRDKYVIMKLNDHDEEVLPREFNTQRGLTPRV